jgi:hypothetical protein
MHILFSNIVDMDQKLRGVHPMYVYAQPPVQESYTLTVATDHGGDDITIGITSHDDGS